MTRDDVRLVRRERSFDGYFKVDTYTLRHRLFSGDWSPAFTREVLERGHAVVVLLYDPGRDAVVLIEQFRIGALAATGTSPFFDANDSPWLVECVAGIVEEGELPEDVARREAVEEAGCEVLDLTPIQRVMVTPGASSESAFLFCGRVDSSGVGGTHGLADENEDIRPLVLSAEDALAMLDQGRIIQAASVVCLLWLRAHRERLRREWRLEPAP